MEDFEAEFRQDLEQLEQERQMPYISSIERFTIRREIESLLEAKFGELDEQLKSIVVPLGNLPSSKRARMILQMTREDLIAQFSAANET